MTGVGISPSACFGGSGNRLSRALRKVAGRCRSGRVPFHVMLCGASPHRDAKRKHVDQLPRVMHFNVSSDGIGAGEHQVLERPFVHDHPERLFAWAGATASWPMRTDPAGSRGPDDYFTRTRDFARDIGAEIMGRNKFGLQRGPWPDDEWRGWWGKNPPSTPRCSSGPTTSVRRSRSPTPRSTSSTALRPRSSNGVEKLPSGGVNKPVWLWWSRAGATKVHVDRCWQSFLRRFDIEHTFRLFKQTLGWTKPRLGSGRLVDLSGDRRICAAPARPTACRRSPAPLREAGPPNKLTPARIRRGLRNLCTKTGPRPVHRNRLVPGLADHRVPEPDWKAQDKPGSGTQAKRRERQAALDARQDGASPG